jgi:hypothetical protein
MTDLYSDGNLFQNPQGEVTSSYRQFVTPSEQASAMNVKQEVEMEFAIDPDGRSGQQWDAWKAMYSPKDPETGIPVPLFDPQTGIINNTIIRHWARFDLTRILSRNWGKYGPGLIKHVRLVCGTKDSFYLNRAVEKLKALAESQRGDLTGAGYIKLIEGADHSTVSGHIFEQNTEMRDHLIKHGLQDADAPTSKPMSAPDRK